jgi:hypothetical protein
VTPRPRSGNPARRASGSPAPAKATTINPSTIRPSTIKPSTIKPSTIRPEPIAVAAESPDTTGEPPRTSRWAEIAIRVAAAVIAVWAAVLLGVVGAFLTPYRIGGVLVPISVLLGVGGNVLIIWFAYRFTGSKVLGLLPGVLWVVLTMIAAGRTTERDYVLLQSNWVAITYLYGGCAAVGVCAYRLIVPRPPPIRP